MLILLTQPLYFFGFVRSGVLQNFTAVSRGSRMVCPGKSTSTFAPYMNISDSLGIFYSHSAVCRTKEIILAPVRQLHCAVLKNNRCISRQQNSLIQQPVFSFRLISEAAGTYYNDTVRITVLNSLLQ